MTKYILHVHSCYGCRKKHESHTTEHLPYGWIEVNAYYGATKAFVQYGPNARHYCDECKFDVINEEYLT